MEYSADVPAEAFGRRVLYRAPVRGDLNAVCLCRGRERPRPVGSPARADCDGYAVRGLSWANIPWARRVNGEREAYIEFVGVLSRDGISVVEPPRRPPPSEESVVMRYPFPCGGQPSAKRRIPGHIGVDDEQAALAYAEEQPEHSISYIHWFPGVTAKQQGEGFTADKGALVFWFTENLDEHRKRLEALWGGPMCVAKAELTHELLGGIVARAADLVRRDGKQHGLLCGHFAAGTLAFPDRVTVSGVAWDSERLSNWLSRELAGFPVEVESILLPAREP